ncbi:hypothetical protein BAE44_0013462 [Dichanthelium oligosanthes]|uniref:Uncharacterized protein n=1 Tax=Dichanthelium oligosanthes TaxID=888268 RepID=A0A1E5VKA9_9POAL|nr:hypothetical protein BAE44_0013462 [Dichanthelium oligosanthes]
MMTIMSLGFFLVALALASTSSAPPAASWSGGHHRCSAVLMAPGDHDAPPPAAVVLPTGDGVLAPPPAVPDTLSTNPGGPAPTPKTGRVAAKPRRLVPLPPSGPSNRGHV